MPFKNIDVVKGKATTTYTADKKGSLISLKIKHPPSKFSERVRAFFFEVFGK